MGSVNLDRLNINIYYFKILFLCIFTLMIFIRITNQEKLKNSIKFFSVLYMIITAFFVSVIKYRSDVMISNIFLVFLIGIYVSKIFKKKMGYAIFSIIISYSCNYIIFMISIFYDFIINKIISVKYDWINLIIICTIQFFITINILKIKRIKKGFSFLNNNVNTDFFTIIVLNCSLCVIICSIILSTFDLIVSGKFLICLIIFSFVFFETIKESIKLYYKQKLLINDLETTRNELNTKKEEIRKLECDNLESSKSIHSLVHKQKVLEYKVDKLLKNEKSKFSDEIKNDLEKISEDLFKNDNMVELNKTDIREIDDILDFMQSECQKDNIEFNLQLNGNIFQMINNCIVKKDLEILLADHIKDSIIAINHSNNINRSILVKLGYFDNYYSIYIYDSGIEFSEDVLNKLGKMPVTTYKNEGGSGIGFMNTFDTLKKTKGSLIIERIGPPCIDNYTKIVKIKFDGKNEFKII